jgi:hypothetical protein
MLTFMPFGVFCILWAFIEFREGQQSLSWPVAEGIVYSAHIETHHDDEGGVSYSPRIAYHYSVTSNTYSGNRIRAVKGTDAAGRNYSKTKLLVDSHQPGSTVRVFYNPNQPESSVLVPGSVGRTLGLLVGGVIFSGFSLCIWVFRRKIEDYSLARQRFIDRYSREQNN